VDAHARRTRSTIQWAGLLTGPLMALLTYWLLPESYADTHGELVSFGHAGRATTATAVWMAIWWMTEAIAIYATALLPLALLPLLGATSIQQAARPYGHELIYLFMGGFILALSMQRWGLHRRLAYFALQLVGTRASHIVGGFMLVTATFSMWVSNTATTLAMLPIALSVIELALGPGRDHPHEETRPSLPDQGSGFALCLFLGIAYAASIGGIGTIVGTPPNLFMASFVKSQLGLEISFVRWMGVGLPLVGIFLPLVWVLLTRVLYPLGSSRIEGGAALTRDAYRGLGPMNRGERITGIVFLLTVGAWIFRPLLVGIEVGGLRPLAGLSDPGVAMIAALSLFVIPVDMRRRVFTMNWETAVKLPWGLLVLFGGGLSLAAALKANGVGEWIGNQMGALAGLPSVVLVLGVVAIVIFLTELTSNTATTATLLPILAGLAPGLGLDPMLLIVPAAIAASCAFMLPVATPPNAIVFGSGHVTIPQMSRAGLWLNVTGILLITGLTYAVAMPLLGVNPVTALSTP
jgi:sodium-dependent dicarboxylate transporter 2/3/5